MQSVDQGRGGVTGRCSFTALRGELDGPLKRVVEPDLVVRASTALPR
jgi:hypothetical protein